jgi:hypothetical protein
LLFDEEEIRFTLVGSAACREYGLSRIANDLDFVVSGYPQAMRVLLSSGKYRPVLDSPDPTERTCTQLDLRTGVTIDFLTAGIRINDRTWLNSVFYTDPLPIPSATGFGDLASLPTLVAMKVNTVTSGLDTLQLGANTGGRSVAAVRNDISDLKELIAVNRLRRDLAMGNELLQCKYEQIFDGTLSV